MGDCLFCKIINWEINSTKVYEDENYLAFNDVFPRAKHHILIVPKKHIDSFIETDLEDQELVKWLMDIAWKISEKQWFKWCQLHFNSWKDHEQEINHIHLHLMNGINN